MEEIPSCPFTCLTNFSISFFCILGASLLSSWRSHSLGTSWHFTRDLRFPLGGKACLFVMPQFTCLFRILALAVKCFTLFQMAGVCAFITFHFYWKKTLPEKQNKCRDTLGYFFWFGGNVYLSVSVKVSSNDTQVRILRDAALCR